MLLAFFLATLVVAFLAGIFALAMPCCFTVLLPSYLAKSFATPAGRLGMTAVFGGGMATVLLPIALGVTYLSSFITLNHSLLFVVGGFFMIILGLLTMWGVSMLPTFRARVNLASRDVPSVYALGVFGGVASSCCAPVLAGVVVLTVLAGNWLSALTVGLAYMLGMIFPLLLVAIAWDRRSVPGPRVLQGRMISLRAIGIDAEIHSSKLVAGVLFISMGVFTIVLGVLDRMLLNPLSDAFAVYQATLETTLVQLFSDPIAVAGTLGMMALLAVFAFRRLRRASGLRTGPDALAGSGDRLPSQVRPASPAEKDTSGESDLVVVRR